MSQTTVGELNIRLNMELARLESQIKQANAKVKSAGASWNGDIGKAAKMINGTLATIGVGASLSGLIAFGKQCLDLGGNIVDLSSQAGLATDAFQALRLAAMENGSTGEEVAAAFAKMNRSMQEAIEGGKSQAEAFEKLNLSAAYLKTLAPETRFELIARAVIGAKDSQEAYNAAADIFGAKIGPKLNQLLTAMATQGYDKIAEGNKKMTLTPEQLKTLDDAGDKLARIWELTKLQGAKGIVAIASIVDPAQIEILNQQIENLERLKAAGKITVAWNSRDDIVNVGDKIAQLTAARDRLAGATSASPILSNDGGIAAIEAQSRAAAEANELAALNLSILKATTEAEKDQAEVKKANDAYATAYNKTLSDTDQKMRGYAEAAMSAIDPTHGLAKEIEGIQAAADYGLISVENAAAAINKLTEAAGEADLDSFLAGMNAEYADEIKEVNAEAARTKRLADNIGDAFGDAFERAILDGQKVGDMLKSLGRDILALVVRQSITAPIASGISGLISGGIGSLFGGLFGGGITAGGAGAGMNVWQGSTNFGGYAATGADVNPSEWYMVGEKGPEPFIPSTAGTIVSNSDLMSAMGAEGGGGGTSITVVQNFAAGVSQSQLAESMRQTREAAKAGVMDAIQRRGGGFGMVAA